MTKNRPKKLPCHLEHILIFCTNEIFLSIFWVQILWDVVKHANTPFLQLCWGSWLPTGRRVAWTKKYFEICGYCLLDPSPEKVSIFL